MPRGAWSAAGVTLPYLAFLITFGVTVALYYVGYEGLHYLMHKPTFPFIEHSGFFKFIKRHHAIHHVYMDKNLNVLLPIADFCLGSLVLDAAACDADAHGRGALVTARKFSRFGQRLEHDTPSPSARKPPRTSLIRERGTAGVRAPRTSARRAVDLQTLSAAPISRADLAAGAGRAPPPVRRTATTMSRAPHHPIVSPADRRVAPRAPRRRPSPRAGAADGVADVRRLHVVVEIGQHHARERASQEALDRGNFATLLGAHRA